MYVRAQLGADARKKGDDKWVACHAPTAFTLWGETKKPRNSRPGQEGVFTKRLSHNGTVRVTSFLTSCQVASSTAASVLLCRRQLDVARLLMIAPANDEAGDAGGGVGGTKLAVFAARLGPLQPPDDRTSTFDPLPRIETVPMNLPAGISAKVAKIKPTADRPRSATCFLFLCGRGGEMFARGDKRYASLPGRRRGGTGVILKTLDFNHDPIPPRFSSRFISGHLSSSYV